MNVTAQLEGYVRALCVAGTRARYKSMAEKFGNIGTEICRDGYTMDFFYRLTGTNAKAFKPMQHRLWAKMAGFREICLTNVSPRTVRLVESVYKPVGEAESVKPE